MTPNIAGAVFNVLVLAFFVVVLLGVALGAYAANAVKKAQQANDSTGGKDAGAAA